jgi:hypothetical protein
MADTAWSSEREGHYPVAFNRPESGYYESVVGATPEGPPVFRVVVGPVIIQYQVSRKQVHQRSPLSIRRKDILEEWRKWPLFVANKKKDVCIVHEYSHSVQYSLRWLYRYYLLATVRSTYRGCLLRLVFLIKYKIHFQFPCFAPLVNFISLT